MTFVVTKIDASKCVIRVTQLFKCPVHLPRQNIFCPGQNQICLRQNNFVNDKIFFVRDKNFVHGFKQVSSKQK